MPEPKFRVGQTVKIGFDPAEWPSPSLQGQSVRILSVSPYDDTRGVFFYDVQTLDSSLRRRVREDWIEALTA